MKHFLLQRVPHFHKKWTIKHKDVDFTSDETLGRPRRFFYPGQARGKTSKQFITNGGVSFPKELYVIPC